MQKGKVNVIIGGQAGSEAKGKASAYLAQRFKVNKFVMTASPNSGHTVVKGPLRFVTYHLPCGIMGHYGSVVVLTPASVINPTILLEEISSLKGDYLSMLWVDPRCGVITPKHIAIENKEMTCIGSTAQGVGEARKSRIGRVDMVMASHVPDLAIYLSASYHILSGMMRRGDTVICESTQGFDLCLEHGIHPRYCTSRVINPAAELGYAGLSPHHLGDVYGVVRPYPIRVNNRTGNSGPYPGSEEISWDVIKERCGATNDLTEMTTTTKLPRRVFEFSWDRWARFCFVCRPTSLFLQFGNYLDWAIYGKSGRVPTSYLHAFPKVAEFVSKMNRCSGGATVDYIGTGPDHEHVLEVQYDG